jgi:predicted alpha/beta superfamily hydrolase
MNWQDYVAHNHSDQQPRGALKVLRDLESPQLGNRRDIFVYLPPSYAREADWRYPVVYMQDGQNLFDARTSFAGEWNVDGTIDAASHDGVEAIVVGIPNMGKDRCSEYSPFDDPKHGAGRGDEYLAFITATLKPIIDADFRTDAAREATGIAGSSMGALIALYGFFKRSDVFGLVGVMSPALWYGNRQIFDFLEASNYVGGRIYVDVGTKEGSEELRDVKRLRDRLLAMEYRHGDDLMFMIDLGGRHHESAWARRMEKQLKFLLSGSCRLRNLHSQASGPIPGSGG